MGRPLLDRLADIATRQKIITGARGLGLMCGVDVIDPDTGKSNLKKRDAIVIKPFELGLIMLGCGEATLRFCPALCINHRQLAVGLSLFEDAVVAAQ
ncbi:MAG: aminotransferase class III-fold pyridoxal phosphate-dependent enzyme [Candidatus Limnocylindrales bacterium]